jgi:hypothetical protein
MELCVARAGMLRGARVAAFIAQWTIVSQALDRPITLEDYGAWWHESERTVYRHQARFREVFPQLKTPQPISDAAIARAGEWRDRGVAGIGELPVSLAVA